VGRIESLRAARQRGYRLRWNGAGDAFLEALRRHGVRIEAYRAARPTEGAMAAIPNTNANTNANTNTNTNVNANLAIPASESATHPVVGGEARVMVPTDWRTREFFAAALAHGVTLQMLAAEEEDLDAVYHRLLGGAGSAREAL
jgi:hypothetical protein